MNETKNKETNSSENSAKRLEGGAMGTSHFGSVAEPVSDYKTIWRKLLSYCRGHIPVIAMALVFAAAGRILQVIGPGRISALTDEINKGLMGSINMEAVASIAFTAVFLYVAAGILDFTQGFIMASVTAKISKNMRTDLSRKINRLPFKYYDRISLGDVLSRITNDVDTIGQTLNQNIGLLVSSAVTAVGVLIMMFYTNWILALITVGTSTIGFAFSKAAVSWSQKYFKAQQQGMGAINGHIMEVYSGHNVVKTYNGMKSAKSTFNGLSRALYAAVWKAQFISGVLTPLMSFVGNLAYVAVCVLGAYLALQGNITFGVIVAFILYANQFTQALTHIAETLPGLQSTTAASERVFEFLGEEELADESRKTKELINIRGDVSFNHVSFGYSRDKTIINDFSADVRNGQKIAIVGPTGAGKTTIVNLLMRFYELDSGEILIDGVPISDVTREAIHDQFSMVLQNTWLFEGTIRENVVYSKKNVTDEQVASVCKAVGLHYYISTLPDGYNTMLNDNFSLSEGQRQLMTIARAMIRNAPMLILDEATSSVDTRTEALIQEAMDKLMTSRTSFVIAHRLSTIKNADLILVMKDGDIIESGNHIELLKKGGFYTELYNSQFEVA